jgi:hypothetical protein
MVAARLAAMNLASMTVVAPSTAHALFDRPAVCIKIQQQLRLPAQHLL